MRGKCVNIGKSNVKHIWDNTKRGKTSASKISYIVKIYSLPRLLTKKTDRNLNSKSKSHLSKQEEREKKMKITRSCSMASPTKPKGTSHGALDHDRASSLPPTSTF